MLNRKNRFEFDKNQNNKNFGITIKYRVKIPKIRIEIPNNSSCNRKKIYWNSKQLVEFANNLRFDVATTPDNIQSKLEKKFDFNDKNISKS